MIRISVANIAMRLRVFGSDEVRYLGILSPGAYKQGIRRVQALGGGAHLTAAGQADLFVKFGAEDFEADGTRFDARFLAPNNHLESVLKWFEKRDPNMLEIDPLREIHEELTKEKLSGIPAVLTSQEVHSVNYLGLKTVRQPPPAEGRGTSMRERSGIPTRRLFYVFELRVPEFIFQKMLHSETIHFLSVEEVATTDGGARKGNTKDGVEIADNIFIV